MKVRLAPLREPGRRGSRALSRSAAPVQDGYWFQYLTPPPDTTWYQPGRIVVDVGCGIFNTIVYRLSGRRLPGFLGDIIFQSERRLRRYYRSAGLTLESAIPSRRFLGQAVFIGHVVRKGSVSSW